MRTSNAANNQEELARTLGNALSIVSIAEQADAYLHTSAVILPLAQYDVVVQTASSADMSAIASGLKSEIRTTSGGTLRCQH